MIQFHSNLAKLFLQYGLLRHGLGVDSAITVYSGVQPTAQQILDNWPEYNAYSVNCLAHYNDVMWSQPLNNTANFISISKFPVSPNHPHNGIGQWCILWGGNPPIEDIAEPLIPTNEFIVGPISLLSGNGIVRYNDDLVFTAGSPKIMADGVISASSAV
jgi:hypothetical protein